MLQITDCLGIICAHDESPTLETSINPTLDQPIMMHGAESTVAATFFSLKQKLILYAANRYSCMGTLDVITQTKYEC